MSTPTRNATLSRVLYVDDEPDIREVVELALGIGDIAVTSCGSGTEALQLIPQLKPQLVLLDVMMPDLDGPGMLARMRSDTELRDVPVIFMTAKALPQEVDRFLSLGAAGVVAKPFDPMQLAARVKEIWLTLVASGGAKSEVVSPHE